jgi:hypothetical protein
MKRLFITAALLAAACFASTRFAQAGDLPASSTSLAIATPQSATVQPAGYRVGVYGPRFYAGVGRPYYGGYGYYGRPYYYARPYYAYRPYYYGGYNYSPYYYRPYWRPYVYNYGPYYGGYYYGF